MDEVFNRDLMEITARFVAEHAAGQQPRLEDYLRRYPDYAAEIADFVTYYYAVEAPLPPVTEALPLLSPLTRQAGEQAWKRVALEESPLANMARYQQYSLAQLAYQLDLGNDLVEQMALRQIVPSSIPDLLMQELARVLAQSTELVFQALGALEKRPGLQLTLAEERQPYDLEGVVVLSEKPAGQRLAEPRSPYGHDLPAPEMSQTFRTALLASPHMSSTQKDYWLAVLAMEKPVV